MEGIRNGGGTHFWKVNFMKSGFSELSEGGHLLIMSEEKGLLHSLKKAYRYTNIRNWEVQKLFGHGQGQERTDSDVKIIHDHIGSETFHLLSLNFKLPPSKHVVNIST